MRNCSIERCFPNIKERAAKIATTMRMPITMPAIAPLDRPEPPGCDTVLDMEPSAEEVVDDAASPEPLSPAGVSPSDGKGSPGESDSFDCLASS